MAVAVVLVNSMSRLKRAKEHVLVIRSERLVVHRPYFGAGRISGEIDIDPLRDAWRRRRGHFIKRLGQFEIVVEATRVVPRGWSRLGR